MASMALVGGADAVASARMVPGRESSERSAKSCMMGACIFQENGCVCAVPRCELDHVRSIRIFL